MAGNSTGRPAAPTQPPLEAIRKGALLQISRIQWHQIRVGASRASLRVVGEVVAEGEAPLAGVVEVGEGGGDPSARMLLSTGLK